MPRGSKGRSGGVGMGTTSGLWGWTNLQLGGKNVHFEDEKQASFPKILLCTILHIARHLLAKFPPDLEDLRKVRQTHGQLKLCSASGVEVVSMLSAVDEENDDAWYERDLADFDLIVDGNSSHNDDANDDSILKKSTTIQKHTRNKSRGKVHGTIDKITEMGECGGRSYPIDVWFLIGRYVQPEDIGRFAAICRATRLVTYSAQFWQTIYFRYYSPSVLTLPPALSPMTVDRVHGLKARVVRALHYLYSPWVERVVCSTVKLDSLDATTASDNFTSLEGATCLRQWCNKSKQGTGWSFYWTFIQPIATAGWVSGNSADSLLAAPDVSFNREAGLVVLQATSPNFIQLSQVAGLVLVRIGTCGISGSMYGSRGHKLQLMFHDAHHARRIGRQGTCSSAAPGSTTVALDPVLHVDVLHWWHPAYPANK